MFATGIHSEAICDRCGFQIKYLALHKQIENQVWNGMLVCEDCLDQDHPQLQVGKLTARTEGIALHNPRPDNWDRIMSTAYWNWNPVTCFELVTTVNTVVIGIS